MVGGLVEQQRLGLGEEDSRQFDPATLAARHRRHGLVELGDPDPEIGGDLFRFGLGDEAALGVELVLQPGVSSDGLVPGLAIEPLHLLACLLDPSEQGADLAGGKNPFESGHVRALEIGQGCFLGEVTEIAGAED